jgi:hypothetical protein
MDYDKRIYGGISSGQIGTFTDAPSEKIRAPFYDGIEDANRQLADLCQRLEAIAGNLCGTYNTVASGGIAGSVPTPVPNGLFERIEHTGREQLERLAFARDQLSRIERALP